MNKVWGGGEGAGMRCYKVSFSFANEKKKQLKQGRRHVRLGAASDKAKGVKQQQNRCRLTRQVWVGGDQPLHLI